MFFRKSSSKSVVAFSLVGALFGAGSALAAPVTFQFSGTVFQVGSSFSADTAIGDTITGTYTFETTTPDLLPSVSEIGRYVNAVSSLSYTVGGVSGSSTANQTILVGDNVFGSFPLFSFIDGYTVFGQTATSSTGFTGASEFKLSAATTTTTLLADDSLPASPSFFGGGAFSGPSDAALIDIFASTGNFAGISDQGLLVPAMQGFSAISGQIRATIDSLVRISAVSEPAVLGLFGVGFLGFQYLRRRRKI